MIIFTDSTGRQMTIARGTVIAVAAVIIAVAVAFYVLRGLGLYKLAKKHGVKYPFLAWIPFAWFYIVCMLVGGVALFGRRFEKFALAAFIVCTVAGVFYAAIEIIYYYPIVGYYLQGGDIEFLSTSSGTEIHFYDLIDYSEGFRNALGILFYFGRILNIISIFFTVIVYSNFFRSFLPNHYFIATIFSIFGLFGPWAFVVRNNEKVNYADYMRARYAAFYGINRGYGGTPTPPPSSEKNDVDPFENMDGGKKDRGNDDPFGEFSDDKKD